VPRDTVVSRGVVQPEVPDCLQQEVVERVSLARWPAVAKADYPEQKVKMAVVPGNGPTHSSDACSPPCPGKYNRQM